MSEKKFSKSEAIKVGWNLMKPNLGFLAIVYSIVFVVTGILEIIVVLTQGSYPLISFNINIISFILSVFTGIGATKIYLKLYDKQKSQLTDLYDYYYLFFKYLGGFLLCGLIVIGGFILLVIPGIIFMIKYQFFTYLIVDKEMGPVEAIKKSGKITQGSKWNLFLFGLVLVGVNLLGALCLLVGLIVTIPVTCLAYTFVYRKLLEKSEAKPVDVQSVHIEPPTLSTPEII
ncbi:MAG: DUF975 family protein [Candidatus Firestonebacteria bacterium]